MEGILFLTVFSILIENCSISLCISLSDEISDTEPVSRDVYISAINDDISLMAFLSVSIFNEPYISNIISAAKQSTYAVYDAAREATDTLLDAFFLAQKKRTSEHAKRKIRFNPLKDNSKSEKEEEETSTDKNPAAPTAGTITHKTVFCEFNSAE